jgi:hypothetical protein
MVVKSGSAGVATIAILWCVITISIVLNNALNIRSFETPNLAGKYLPRKPSRE